MAQHLVAGNQEPTANTGVATAPTGVFAEPRAISRAIDVASRMFGDGGDGKNGLYAETSNMPTGSGWISVGPGYRHWLFDDHAMIEASTAISWRSFKMAQARFELPRLARSRLAAGSQVRWQDLTQISFWGHGPDSFEDDRSHYRLKSTNVSGYATLRPAQWLAIGGKVGWLDRPSLLPPAGSFKRDVPATQDVVYDDQVSYVFSLPEQPPFVYGETSITADTRDQRSHPTRGGVYRAAFVHYSDRDAGTFSFNRAETEATRFVPLANSRLVLAMHGWFVATATDTGHMVPFYLEPSLGGHNTLRGYSDYRFHDRNLLVLNVESRLALMTHVDVALFADAGNVASRIEDLNLNKTSIGVGLRLHTQKSTFARFETAHGVEGWSYLFRMNDPLHLTRLSRRIASIPFVP